ncbi:uncharacterized protein LOC108604463 isoform X2 [Drosophila busckii]|uniref:uncharacterized protein LOC108604463 isoform X2 n=1 Tax=Drosophila busckii TaxID=30019 RepID=UPI00083ECC5C|nr:uncharacterized protein LOC108604463 isoform X2 [Drosophila busckii]
MSAAYIAAAQTSHGIAFKDTLGLFEILFYTRHNQSEISVHCLMSERRYYFKAEQRYNTSGDGEEESHVNVTPLYPCDNNNNKECDINHSEQEPDNDDDLEFLQDVPNSPSSIDRSSIGSIPWADDAIKKNKLDWEKVERMLTGEAPLIEMEPDLRHEISDWHNKFPCVLAIEKKPLMEKRYDANVHFHDRELDSISDLSLNSLNEYGDSGEQDNGFLTPTVGYQWIPKMPTALNYIRSAKNLDTKHEIDLQVTPLKLNLRKREHSQSSLTHRSPQSITTATATAAVTCVRSYLRMPPIFNVVDSNHRFRGLLNNRSFVQLTQVQVQQQPKSAAILYASSAERRQPAGICTAWHMPMVSTRFLSNKHSIVLPSLNPQRDHSTTCATSSHSISSSVLMSGDNSTISSLRSAEPIYKTQSAVHNPRAELVAGNGYSLPYSAKLKAHK